MVKLNSAAVFIGKKTLFSSKPHENMYKPVLSSFSREALKALFNSVPLKKKSELHAISDFDKV